MIQAIYLVDRNAGLPILSQTYGDFASNKADVLLTGVFSVLESYIRELIKGKDASEPEEIFLSGLRIIYARDENLPVIIVGLSDENTHMLNLRKKLIEILEVFCQEYSHFLKKFPYVDISLFHPFKEELNRELENGAFAHVENFYPMLKEKGMKTINYLRKFGVLKPAHYKVAQLCNVNKSVLEISEELNLEMDEVLIIIDYLRAQGILEPKKIEE